MSEKQNSDNQNEVQSERTQSNSQENAKDTFWVKVLVTTVVLIWVSLAAGTWVGNYVIEKKIQPDKESYVNASGQKPRAWKTVVEIDKNGQYSKVALPESELKIDDFRNTDNPIPGIDDRYLVLPDSKHLQPIQEPQMNQNKDELPPPLPQPSFQTATPSPSEPATSDSPDTSKNNQTEPTPSEVVNQHENHNTPKGTYVVQIGSYSSRENADKIINELEKKGYKTTFDIIRTGDREFYKVKIAQPSTSQFEAKSQADKLKKDGFDSIIITQ